MLIRDNFQAQHRDMLISACCEPLSKEEIEARRKSIVGWDFGNEDKSVICIMENDRLKILEGHLKELYREFWYSSEFGDEFKKFDAIKSGVAINQIYQNSK